MPEREHISWNKVMMLTAPKCGVRNVWMEFVQAFRRGHYLNLMVTRRTDQGYLRV